MLFCLKCENLNRRKKKIVSIVAKKNYANMNVNLSVLFFMILIGYATARSGLHSEESAPPAKVQQCREGCLEKVIFFFNFF